MNDVEICKHWLLNWLCAMLWNLLKQLRGYNKMNKGNTILSISSDLFCLFTCNFTLSSRIHYMTPYSFMTHMQSPTNRISNTYSVSFKIIINSCICIAFIHTFSVAIIFSCTWLRDLSSGISTWWVWFLLSCALDQENRLGEEKSQLQE